MAKHINGITKKAPSKKRSSKRRPKAGGKWTNARYWQFIRGILRQGYQKYPVKQICKENNRREVTGKRYKFEYHCAQCNGWFPDKQIQVDHIKPVGSLKDYRDLPRFVRRLYCEIDNLQILCLDCHAEKTAAERKGE